MANSAHSDALIPSSVNGKSNGDGGGVPQEMADLQEHLSNASRSMIDFRLEM